MESLHQRTLALLRTSDKTMIDISYDLRSKGITYYWLRRLKQGGIEAPSVDKIQILYEYLADEELTTV